MGDPGIWRTCFWLCEECKVRIAGKTLSQYIGSSSLYIVACRLFGSRDLKQYWVIGGDSRRENHLKQNVK